MKFLIFLIFIIKFTNNTFAEVDSVNALYPLLDQKLHQDVLDSEQCQKQLRYLWQNNTLLLAQFLDAGLRVPRGILKGGLSDYGLFNQCLGIHEIVDDTNIDGKYCSIRVPINLNIASNGLRDMKWNFDPNLLQIDDTTRTKLEVQKRYMKKLLDSVGNNLENTELYQDNSFPEIFFSLALCIPKVCTTRDFFSGFLVNLTALGFEYQDDMCRLPNDRTWSAADNTAIIIFGLIGLLTLLSTSYDVHHIFIRKRDPKEVNLLLSSFSAYRNCSQLLTIEDNPKAIHCLDGIRALATFWVLIGHVFVVFNFLIANQLDAMEWTQSYNAIWIMVAQITVDTFFLISGLLLTFTTVGKIKSRRSLSNLPILFLFRVLRMFPILAAVILFEVSFLNRLGDGPNWGMVMGNVQNCRTYWWATLLHIQNYVSPANLCVGVSWYLAIDVNLHFISIILFCFILGRGKKIALAGLLAIFITSLTSSTAYIFAYKAMRDNYFQKYYINILTRAPPFFLGLLYGYAMSLLRGKRLRLPLYLNVLVTSASIGTIATVLYLHFEYQQRGTSDNIDLQNALDAFLRTLWCLGLGWIIFICSKGHGGPINWFLSLKIWKIPARISYSMYLFHMSFMIAVYGNMQQPQIFTLKLVMFHFMSFFAIAMVVAFFMTALIDAPFGILLKILFELIMPKPPAKKPNIQIEEHANNDVDIDVVKTTKAIE